MSLQLTENLSNKFGGYKINKWVLLVLGEDCVIYNNTGIPVRWGMG